MGGQELEGDRFVLNPVVILCVGHTVCLLLVSGNFPMADSPRGVRGFHLREQ